MASTERAESDSKVTDRAYKKRFVTTPSKLDDPEPDGTVATKGPDAAGALMSRPAAIGGVGMGAVALLCFVLAAGLSGSEATVSPATAHQIAALREQIQLVEAKVGSLPNPKDAARGLVTALRSANEVAQLQNDYRHLAPSAAAGGGTLDPSAIASTRQNLTPYFTPSVKQSALEPWYLLASDKDVSAGVGIPMSFDSGFEWAAQRPYTVNDDSTVRVTWLAVQTRPGKGRSAAVLAWARADFDMVREVFSNIQTGTTATGEALRLEAKTP
jgi:hypothetical protein